MSDITNIGALFGSRDQQDINDPGNSGGKRFFGKYRGTVMNNVDLLQLGRLQVQVPDVFGTFFSSWAKPCVPWGGLQMGMVVVPPIHAKVWVEFEQGNPDFPIWTGCFWDTKQEAPLAATLTTPGMPTLVIQTLRQTAVVVSDTPVALPAVPPMSSGGILLRCGASSILIDTTGVYISGPIVSVNNGALTVLK